MICVDCFQNEGLRRSALKEAATRVRTKCERCGNVGYVLSKSELQRLSYVFFVSGSVPPYQPHGTPMVQVSEDRNRGDQVRPGGTLRHDFDLLQSEIDFSLFYYGPAEWRLGYTEPHAALEAGGEQAAEALAHLLSITSSIELPTGSLLYRIRLGEVSADAAAFDPPPRDIRRGGRFDTPEMDVLYVSLDIETCLHECRVTVVDEVVLATLRTAVPLSLLDLAGEINEDRSKTPFEDLRYTLPSLFYAGAEEYDCCRKISGAVRAAGYDGFVYPSYFSFVGAGSTYNIALFGRPLENGSVIIQSLNRLRLGKVSYEYEFGPVIAELTA